MFKNFAEDKSAWIFELIISIFTTGYMLALNNYNKTIFSVLGNKDLNLQMCFQILKFPHYGTYLFYGLLSIIMILISTWYAKKTSSPITVILIIALNIGLLCILWGLLWNPIVRALFIVLVAMIVFLIANDS